ncbi:MAG: O-antigen ligase family protein [Flavobacterium sp.]|nr:O-antigen ligase family protein [Flavobacterium sp.]
MANIYDYLKNASHELRQENSRHPSLIFVVIALLSIPMSYAVNSIAVAALTLISIINFRKENFQRDFQLFLPIALYGLMLVSLLWSVDISSSAKALSKELPLLLIPLFFLLIRPFSDRQKQLIIKYYSYGILLYGIFYLVKAAIRFIATGDSSVFFYHELVTKDVNAIHVSVYVAVAFFYFLTRTGKKAFHYFALLLLFGLVFLLSSKNIIVVFAGLLIIHQVFFTKTARRMRLRNLAVLIIALFSLTFVGKIKDRFKQEYETMMTDSSVNDVIGKGSGTVYNVSIKQAWTQERFSPNDYFPGTAFRVYQFRIFTEMLAEDNIFFSGYGINASYPKIEEKTISYNLFLGNGENEGYQTKNFHNQYIQIFAELGIFGFLLLLLMLLLNVKIAIKTKDFVHISFAVLMISLFLTESFLWRQRGVVFFTLMYCLFNSGVMRAPNQQKI